MLVSAFVVSLLLAGLIVPVVLSRIGRPVAMPRMRARKAPRPQEAPKPPLRLVVRPDDMDRELNKLLEEDRR